MLTLLALFAALSAIQAGSRTLPQPPDPPAPPPRPPAAIPAPPAAPQIALHPSEDPTVAGLDDLVERYARLGRFSGALLLGLDGRILYARALGLSNRAARAPNGLSTRFAIGSLTKQFTAAAILQLESEGKLSVHDPIVKWLPDYPGPAGEEVTIHHLLSMSSGIPSLWRRGDGLEAVEMGEEPVTLEEQIAFSHGKDLIFQPGQKYRYSNTNYIILAAIIERASGMRWADALRTRLFEPAGMHDTGVHDSLREIDRAATGYVGHEPDVREARRNHHPSWGLGAGGVYSTVTDLLQWDAILRTDRVLSAKQRQTFFAHHTNWGDGGFYAYGWWGYSIAGRRVLNHGGTTEGFVSGMYRFPEEKLVLIALTNHQPKLGVDLAADLGERVLARLFGEAVAIPPMPARDPPPDIERFAGLYRLAPGYEVAVHVAGGKLVAETSGPEPWSLYTWESQGRVERSRPEVRRALQFTSRLESADYEGVVELLSPEWRKSASPSDFQKSWERLLDRHGPLAGSSVVGTKKQRLTSVIMLLQFERRMVELEVVLTEAGDVGGWWTEAEVPQGRSVLRPAEDGGWFVDGFRWRRSDLRVEFVEHDGAVEAVVIEGSVALRVW